LEPVIANFLQSTPSVSARVRQLKAEVEDRMSEDGERERGEWELPRYDIHNLFTVEQFMEDLGIVGTRTLVFDGEELVKRVNGTEQIDYLTLRRRQNQAHARGHVEVGIKLFQADDLKRAMNKYAQALDLDPECVDAFIARGCLFAKQQKYDDAIADFQRALGIDPDNNNAYTYWKRTVAKRDEINREKQSAADGEFLLPADYDPNPSAKKRLAVGLDNPLLNLSANSSVMETVSSPPRKKEKKKEKEKKKKERKRRHERSVSSERERDSRKRKRHRSRSGTRSRHASRSRSRSYEPRRPPELLEAARNGCSTKSPRSCGRRGSHQGEDRRTSIDGGSYAASSMMEADYGESRDQSLYRDRDKRYSSHGDERGREKDYQRRR
ncbi:Tetratricopeptide repeat protein 14, partial [Rhizophlyctis rosea]